MSDTVPGIGFGHLALAFIPVIIVVLIQYHWSMKISTTIHGLARMLIQLLLIGYVLVYLFETDTPLVVLGVLFIMIGVSSWIALRPVSAHRGALFGIVAVSIFASGVSTLALVVIGVLAVEPWYAPRYVIPLAGMIFANSMNTVSIAAERLLSELASGSSMEIARRTAYQAALIPVVNSLFAVGLVSLPGMMTGQVLSGVSPLIAARYQIVVMCMIFGSAGIASACFLYWAGKKGISRIREPGNQN